MSEVARLAKAGLNDEVLKAFVERSTNSYVLPPETLIYLSDLGVAPEVIVSMQRKSAPAPEPAGQAVAPRVAASGLPAAAAPAATAVTTTEAAPAAPAAAAPTPPVTPTYVNPGPVPGVIQPAPAQPVVVQQPVIVQQPVVVQQPVSVAYFEDALAPHGVWIDVPVHGRCWRPNYAVLGAGWRPYVDGGRWVWSAHGWYWVSDYDWGWAPFHYGRWTLAGDFGWVWAPDTVWGPAWVSWRRTSSHCGWAPLPPGAYWRGGDWWFGGNRVGFSFGFGLGYASYTFLPWGRLCEPRPHHFYASAPHRSALFRESTVVNNTIIGNNNTIIFEGVGRQAVAAASRNPIPQASLRETAWTTGANRVREQVSETPSGLVVQSPRLGAAPPVRPGGATGSGRWAPASSSAQAPSPAPISPSRSTAESAGTVRPSAPSGIIRETGRAVTPSAPFAPASPPAVRPAPIRAADTIAPQTAPSPAPAVRSTPAAPFSPVTPRQVAPRSGFTQREDGSLFLNRGGATPIPSGSAAAERPAQPSPFSQSSAHVPAASPAPAGRVAGSANLDGGGSPSIRNLPPLRGSAPAQSFSPQPRSYASPYPGGRVTPESSPSFNRPQYNPSPAANPGFAPQPRLSAPTSIPRESGFSRPAPSPSPAPAPSYSPAPAAVSRPAPAAPPSRGPAPSPGTAGRPGPSRKE